MRNENFVQPYAQKALGDQAGLTSRDLAKALGVQHSNVMQKLNRNDVTTLNDEGFNLTVSTIKLPGRGRPRKHYVMDTDTAKLILVQWSSKVSRSYFRYLLQCEKAVEVGIPKLQNALNDAMKKVQIIESERDAFKYALESKKSKKRGPKLVKIITNTTTEYDLFGNPVTTIKYTEKKYSDLDKAELREQQIRHRSKVMKGLSDAQEKAINGRYDEKMAVIKHADNLIRISDRK